MKRDYKIDKLYNRFLRNEATAAELGQLLSYFEEGEETEMLNLIREAINKIEDDIVDEKRARHLAHLSVAIMDKIGREKDNVPQPSLLIKIRRLSIFKIAASILLAATLGFAAYQYVRTEETIKPGGNFATLITNTGEKTDLNSGAALPKECCVTVRKTNDGRIIYESIPGQSSNKDIRNTIVTPLGGRYKVILSDGSLVLLNSGSSLEFPVGFHGAERKVKLTGEAYFEITKNPAQPFIVESGNKAIEVLGTKFNISSYEDDNMWSSTLLEGKIRFTDHHTQHAEVLKPGERLSVSNGIITMDSLNAEDAMAWKDGMFLFKNEELSAVMHKISRWYNVEVNYSDLPQHRLYAKISMNAQLEDLLRMISLTSNLKFKVEERRISVYR